MGFKLVDVVATLIFNLIHCAYAEHILSCNVTKIPPCPGNNQICKQSSLECECLDGFVRVGEECEAPSPYVPEDHSATAAVVTIFTLALIIGGLVLIIRKYNLIDYARQKINARRNNDVMYEDVMIGQDDPPLSP